MSDIKSGARDLKDDVKETWRKADGDESIGDKIANAGDRMKSGVENLGDEVHEKTDDAGRKLEYERGRVDEAAGREDLGDR